MAEAARQPKRDENGPKGKKPPKPIRGRTAREQGGPKASWGACVPTPGCLAHCPGAFFFFFDTCALVDISCRRSRSFQ